MLYEWIKTLKMFDNEEPTVTTKVASTREDIGEIPTESIPGEAFVT